MNMSNMISQYHIVTWINNLSFYAIQTRCWWGSTCLIYLSLWLNLLTYHIWPDKDKHNPIPKRILLVQIVWNMTQPGDSYPEPDPTRGYRLGFGFLRGTNLDPPEPVPQIPYQNPTRPTRNPIKTRQIPGSCYPYSGLLPGSGSRKYLVYAPLGIQVSYGPLAHHSG